MTNPSPTYSTSETSLWQRISTFHKVKLTFLTAAFCSFALSVVLWFLVDKETGLFVGLWVPSLLALVVMVLVGEDDSP